MQLLLYKLTQDETYAEDFKAFADSWMAKKKTPKGLIFYGEWGPNRYASNMAFLLLTASHLGINPDGNRDFAVKQVYE